MNILEFCVLMTVGLFIELNNLAKNVKCYIKNAGKRGEKIKTAKCHETIRTPFVDGGCAD